MKCLPVLFLIVALAALSAAIPAYAGGVKNELSLSAALSSPKDGDRTYNGSVEVLVPLFGSTFLVGPSVSIFDAGEASGHGIGLTGEVGVGKTSGLFFGAGLKRLDGNREAALPHYSGEARAGVKFGGTGAAVKIYGSEVWTRGDDKVINDPEGFSVNAGVVLRF